jgi:hypothetical protein
VRRRGAVGAASGAGTDVGLESFAHAKPTRPEDTSMLDPTAPAAALNSSLVSDMQLDFRTSSETLFLLIELSDAMRRGVRHYKLDGTPLDKLNNVVEALIFEGEVFFDDAESAPPRGH